MNEQFNRHIKLRDRFRLKIPNSELYAALEPNEKILKSLDVFVLGRIDYCMALGKIEPLQDIQKPKEAPTSCVFQSKNCFHRNKWL